MAARMTMRVALKFDEDDYDIIDVYHESSFSELKEIQASFYDWIGNKLTDHPFWRVIHGKKAYCEYRADAFVYYLTNCRNIEATIISSFQNQPATDIVLEF